MSPYYNWILSGFCRESLRSLLGKFSVRMEGKWRVEIQKMFLLRVSLKLGGCFIKDTRISTLGKHSVMCASDVMDIFHGSDPTREEKPLLQIESPISAVCQLYEMKSIPLGHHVRVVLVAFLQAL